MINESDFGKAFNAARTAGQSVFSFGGKDFTTRKAGESSTQWKSSITPKKVAPVPMSRDSRPAQNSSVPLPRRRPTVSASKPMSGNPANTVGASKPLPPAKPASGNPANSTGVSKAPVSGLSMPKAPQPKKAPVSGLSLPKTPQKKISGIDVNKRVDAARDTRLGATQAALQLAKRKREERINNVNVVNNMKDSPRRDNLQKSLDDYAKKKREKLKEEIKGWKNAASDIAKYRSGQSDTSHTVRLKNDGTESKMNDARTGHKNEKDAREYHERVKKLNPNKKIGHALYVDGKFKEKLLEGIVYSDNEGGKGGTFNPNKFNPNTMYAKHLENHHYLNFILHASKDAREKIQAGKEIDTAAKKMKYWSRHPEFSQKQAETDHSAAKKRWNVKEELNIEEGKTIRNDEDSTYKSNKSLRDKIKKLSYKKKAGDDKRKIEESHGLGSISSEYGPATGDQYENAVRGHPDHIASYIHHGHPGDHFKLHRSNENPDRHIMLNHTKRDIVDGFLGDTKDVHTHLKMFGFSKTKNLGEEVEQLDEVGDTSKGRTALKNYIGKASHSIRDMSSKSGILTALDVRNKEKYGKKMHDDEAHAMNKKTYKRANAISGAVRRLTKEEIDNIEEEQDGVYRAKTAAKKKFNNMVGTEAGKINYWTDGKKKSPVTTSNTTGKPANGKYKLRVVGEEVSDKVAKFMKFRNKANPKSNDDLVKDYLSKGGSVTKGETKPMSPALRYKKRTDAAIVNAAALKDPNGAARRKAITKKDATWSRTYAGHPSAVKEETELDETSNATLRSFIGKASGDEKRTSGVRLAAKKLVGDDVKVKGTKAKWTYKEEVEQLDEIGDTKKGQKALNSYMNKADGEMASIRSRENSGYKLSNKTRDQFFKRFHGYAKANSRLKKEELNIEEVEQLDEIGDTEKGRAALSSYIEKSKSRGALGYGYKPKDEADSIEEGKTIRRDEDSSYKDSKRIKDKVKKFVYQKQTAKNKRNIEEASTRKLNDYHDAASKFVYDNKDDSTLSSKHVHDMGDKVAKRLKFMGLAGRKIAKAYKLHPKWTDGREHSPKIAGTKEIVSSKKTRKEETEVQEMYPEVRTLNKKKELTKTEHESNPPVSGRYTLAQKVQMMNADGISA